MPVLTDLTVAPAKIDSPLQTIGQIAALRGTQAEIALRHAQTAQAGIQTQDLASQAQQRQRDLSDQNIMQEAMKDPAVAKAIGAGDFSSVTGKIQAKALLNLQTNVLDHQQKAATLDKDKQQLAITNAAQVSKAIAGALADPNDPTKEADDATVASRWPGVKSALLAQGFLHPDTAALLPDTVKSADELKTALSHTNYWQGVLETAQGTKKEGSEITKNTSQATEANAAADLNAAKLPGAKATAQMEQDLASFKADHGGMSPKELADTLHAKAQESQGEQRIRLEGAAQALRQKQFDVTFGAGLDANGRPLSVDELKAAALQDPVAVAIAHYQQAPPPAQVRSGAPSPLLRKVYAIDPNYDGTQFAARNKVQQDFSAAGASGKAITSADTALAHLDAISKAGAALKNTDIQQLNRLANALGAQVGDTPKQTYDTIVSMVAPELSKAVIGESGGEGERQKMEHNFTSNASDAQREQAIAGAAGLLLARVHKQAQAYEASMGKPLDLTKRLSPESQAVAARYAGRHAGVQVGDPVTIQGKKMTVTTVHPDGSFDAK